MSSDHLHHHGPTLPPLRPLSLHSLPSDNSTGSPNNNNLNRKSNNSFRHSLNLQNNLDQIDSHKLSSSQNKLQYMNQLNQHHQISNHLLNPIQSSSHTSKPSNPNLEDNLNLNPILQLPPSLSLKRTASRAQLGPSRPSSAQNHYPRPSLPAPLPTTLAPISTHSSRSPNQPNKPNLTRPAHSPSPADQLMVDQADELHVKPEFLTPHLPNQPLPPAPSHGYQPNQFSPSPPSHPSPTHSPLSDHHEKTLAMDLQINPPKKRRVTITHDRLPLKQQRPLSSLSLTPLAIPHQVLPQAPKSPPTRSSAHNSFSKPSSESANDPVSPLVIGFNQPHNPSAIQQVANTIKLREEQKRLIEQRRNSFAGQPSQNPFSFNNIPQHHSSLTLPTSSNSPAPRPSPANPRQATNAHRSSISKQSSMAPSNLNNGLLKLLSHQHLNNPQPPQQRHTPPQHQQQQQQQQPPVVNLPPINEAAAAAANSNKRNSISNHPYRPQPPPPPLLSLSTHQSRQAPVERSSSPESQNPDSPTLYPPSGSGPTIASRRGQLAQDKLKNLAIAPQAFRPQMLVQPTIKSAPMRSGFLQATAPNGEVVTTPLIARTNVAGSNEAPKTGGLHASNQPSRLGRQQHPPASLAPGPSTAHPGLGGFYRNGLERRMTMHAGVPMQVPTLSHVPIFNPSASHPGRGSLSHASVGGGPRTAMAAFGNSSAAGSGEPAGRPNGSHHSSSASSHPNLPPHYMPHHHLSPPDPLHPPPPRPHPSAASLGPAIPPKHMFLQLFDTFYDSLSDSRILQANLEEQIRRSAQLLNLLQQSSGVFEKMLDERVGHVQSEYTRDLQILEGRLERLEEEARINREGEDDSKELSRSGRSAGGSDRTGRAGSKASIGERSGLGSRLERLEREIPRRGADGMETYASGRGGFGCVGAAEGEREERGGAGSSRPGAGGPLAGTGSGSQDGQMRRPASTGREE